MQYGGLLLFYQIKQCFIQYEIQLALENDSTQFQKLTLTLDDFQKYKINENEVSINGKMYDIKSIAISSDKLELIVINDEEEEDLIDKIKKTTSSANRQNNTIPNKLVDLLSLNYISSTSLLNLLLNNAQQAIFNSVNDIIISYKSEISTPPPELV
ncbi:MAG: hypothetical protein ABI851_11220 [Saprospiraceae bacterium]